MTLPMLPADETALGVDSVAAVGPDVDGIHRFWPLPGRGIDWTHPGRLDDSVIDDFAARWLGLIQFRM